MRSCERIQEGLWRYVDRELSAAALAEMSAHLKTCSDCSRVYEARARDAKHYRMALLDTPFGESFVERFRQRFEAEGLASPGGQQPASSGSSPSRGSARGSAWRRFAARAASSPPRKILVRWAPAAAILLMAALVVVGLFPAHSVGKLQLVDASKSTGSGAEVEIIRGGRTLSALPPDLRAGDRIHVAQGGPRVRASLLDGSQILLTGPADLRVENEMEAEGPFLARLSEGTLSASVPRRGAGRNLRMRITTEHASAIVLGTSFTLEAKPGVGTILDVDRGEVDFFASRGGRVLVRAGGRYESRYGYAEPLPVPAPGEAAAARPGEEPPAATGEEPGAAEPQAPPGNVPERKRPALPLDGQPLPDLDFPK